MTNDFTKIRFAGSNYILVTIREKAREPILLLDEEEIKELNKEWIGEEKVIGVSKTKVRFTTHKKK